VDDTFAGKFWMAGGNGTAGTIDLTGCTFNMSGSATGIKLNATSIITATLRSCTVTGTTTGYTLNLEGGTVRLVDTPTPARVRVVPPGALI
jgi:hypothetical protein